MDELRCRQFLQPSTGSSDERLQHIEKTQAFPTGSALARSLATDETIRPPIFWGDCQMPTDTRRIGMRTLLATSLLVVGFGVGLSADAALVTLSNGVYVVHVNDTSGGQLGSWNAMTGASHDVGAGRDLTFNGTTVTTNFSSLRVFGATGNTTYTWGGAGGGRPTSTPSTSGRASAASGRPGSRCRRHGTSRRKISR